VSIYPGVTWQRPKQTISLHLLLVYIKNNDRKQISKYIASIYDDGKTKHTESC
jgi:hypothetical protein